jgi:hypothetical protein
MSQHLSEDIVRRLLVAKHLLAASSGQLTPQSDATAVARMILAAHDAAELAAAGISSHVHVPQLRDSTYLMDYPSKIAETTQIAFPGTGFIRQLNAVRVAFKHHGILPDARTWYRVVDTTWNWIDEWCQTYLGVTLDSIDLEQLLTDSVVKDHYREAQRAQEESQYREALEHVGLALFQVLRRLPGAPWPVVGSKGGSRSIETALMLAAFGVRPSDFLRLQEFLPRVSVSFDLSTNVTGTKLEWDSRGTGHRGNWTSDSVRFCLDTFLDLALKVQHAPQVPMALHFSVVFDDVITPKGEQAADLFEYVYDGKTILTRRAVGRKTIKTLRAGEALRCELSPSLVEEESPGTSGSDQLLAAALFTAVRTVETADVLAVRLPKIVEAGATPEFETLYVEREAITILAEPQDTPFVRQLCPHLF